MPACFTLSELAASTGTVVQGNPEKQIMAVASIEEATESDISFIRDRKYAHYLDSSSAGALILTAELAEQCAGSCLISTNPYLTYAQIVTVLNPVPKPAAGVSPSAVVADDVMLGEGVHIGANVVIAGGCSIGDNTIISAGCVIGAGCQMGVDGLLHPNVTLAGDTCVGDNVILHSGVVLGADGFGFVPQSSGWYKIPQVGRVVIGDDVEIGANTTIDRAALGDTRIGHGVKLDNLIHIAHNVQIGDHTVIAACTGIAGSAKIGSRCQISGMCSIAGHLTVADGTTITATSFVINSITEPGVYSSGTTIDDHSSWRRNAVRFRQLDQLSRRVNALEKQLAKQLDES
ncbi:MAG: UDP-3-O-[3-hydroxymyristoyl] glucosamine N-acyltransferase (EC [uncultured Thiotrichaceae bacterium]|uniref:UDP-3-O-acylglucosamine N-acyltransferase n=1 Tax=uncultured Thiotrichaceae bacterium TaxID=298394 RepID=A0A6S6U328_9GAMM|nr:MAG: UDP-3-O-[3-hydroxymyristoyl] glucosamine N-acyltransferase (EC [uncultured Thiotrichaceae bacterium]